MGNSNNTPNNTPNIAQEKINAKANNIPPIKSNLPKNEEEIFQKILDQINRRDSIYKQHSYEFNNCADYCLSF